MKALIVEDDLDIRETVNLTVKIRWPDTQIVSTHLGEEAISLVESESPDIVILDLGLPDINGYDVLKEIRTFSNVPVIILTARSEEIDITKGLELGADDYVIKPFRQMELVSRIQALLRRSANTFSEHPLICGSMRFSPSTKQLFWDQQEIPLTKTEGVILEKLMRNAGIVVTYEGLSNAIWGGDYTSSSEESLRVYVSRLRKKIEKNADPPQIIITRPGTGYIFMNPQ